MISIGLGTEVVSKKKKNQNSCPHEASIYQNKILYLDLALRKKKKKIQAHIGSSSGFQG